MRKYIVVVIKSEHDSCSDHIETTIFSFREEMVFC